MSEPHLPNWAKPERALEQECVSRRSRSQDPRCEQPEILSVLQSGRQVAHVAFAREHRNTFDQPKATRHRLHCKEVEVLNLWPFCHMLLSTTPNSANAWQVLKRH